jgi:hypothetical protein
VCVFITAGPSTKLFTWGRGGDMGGHVLRDDEQIINMPTFMKLCRENGMQLREFKFGTEKQFPGVVGDMLHLLLKTRKKYEESIKHEEEREASPASGSVAAASGSAAAEGDVRRSDRTRKPKQIFDPSEDPSHVKRVKREPQGD